MICIPLNALDYYIDSIRVGIEDDKFLKRNI